MRKANSWAILVSTHSRLKAAATDRTVWDERSQVSTHSRLKAAARPKPDRDLNHAMFQHTAA